MKSTPKRVLLLVASVAMLAFALAACGGGGSSSSESTEASEATTQSETAADKTSSEGGGNEAGGKQAAEAFIAPYVGQPSAFPVTEKLKEVPKGATIAFMDSGDPQSAAFYEIMEPAAATMGVKLERIKQGSSASTISNAWDTVVAKKPAAVIAMAAPISLFSKQLKELNAAEIPVVVEGDTAPETEGYEVTLGMGSTPESVQLAGELMANYVVAKMTPNANVVWYEVTGVPQFEELTDILTASFESICPGCSFRVTQLPVTALGSTAPNEIVSDLQANPETNVVLTGGPTAIGLPAALHAAGIEVETLSDGPQPTNLQYIKEGKETAGLAQDYPVLVWSLLDQAVRLSIGQELTGPQAEGLSPIQFLTQEDITFDPSKGWTGYPDFAEQFEELWGVKG